MFEFAGLLYEAEVILGASGGTPASTLDVLDTAPVP